MNHRLRTSFALIIITAVLGACSVKDAVPQFEYPTYTPDKEWPQLVPTEDLVNATDVDIEATIEEIERLKRMAI